MNNKSVILTTIGYMCIGFTIWLLNLYGAGWISGPAAYGGVMLFTLGSVVLGVIAILAFLHGDNVLDTVIYFGLAGLFLTEAHHTGGPGMGDAGMGWFWFLWALFFFYLWLASFKAGWARMLFLLADWVTLLAWAIAAWFGVHVFEMIGAYTALLAGLVAIYISAAGLINLGNGKSVLSTGGGNNSSGNF